MATDDCISEFHQALKLMHGALDKATISFFKQSTYEVDSIEDDNLYSHLIAVGARDMIRYLLDGTESVPLARVLHRADELSGG